MNLFLYSSPYTLECFLPNINHLLKGEVNKVYIYNDSYNIDKVIIATEYDIIYENNLDTILKNSHMTIILNDGRISNKFINIISELSIKFEKLFYKINLCTANNHYTSITSKYTLSYDKPVVLICYDGESSQIEQIELAINKLFFEANISFKQMFSKQTYNVLNEIKHITKSTLNDSIDYTQSEYDVLIITFSLQHLLSNNFEVYKDVMYLKPDFVLFCAEHNFSKFENLKNLFKYKYNSKVDLITLSNFFTYKEQEGDIGTRIKTSLIHNYKKFKDIICYDTGAENIVYESIISKITFPFDVKIYNK